MFKAGLVFACFLAVAISGNVRGSGEQKKVEADKEYLTKEKAVLQLLLHVHQPSVVAELKEVSNNYELEQNAGNYANPDVVKRFVDMYKTGGMIGRRDVFSPMYEKHAKQLKTVFDVLYYAKEWETFYKTAAYLRERVNDGMFVYAFYAAVLRRPDTTNLVLPPIYEVRPHLFVRDETVQRAYEARMLVANKGESIDSVVVPTNYTGWRSNSHHELRTSYFTEDVGLNAYHVLYHLSYPHWLPEEYFGSKHDDRKGELFYYVHQQLLARYECERLSNNMYEMKKFSYEESRMPPYNPAIRYPNGKAAPVRPENIQIRDTDVADVDRVRELERRIRKGIDMGYVKSVKGENIPLNDENGVDTLGRIVEKSASSVNPKLYGGYYRAILNLVGHAIDPYHANGVAPSVLQHFETMLRDPAYYRLFKRVNQLFVAYKKSVPTYTKDKLEFPGVTVENIEVDKLMTYFENFDSDVTNAVTVSKVEDDKAFKVVARQPRLNHKDFTYRITVNSDKEVAAMVRVYLSPKYGADGRPLTLNEKRRYMIQIDKFPYGIKNGKNVIERHSKDSTVGVEDMTSFRVLYKQVEDAIQGKSQFYVNEKSHFYGYPRRLLLPKGKKNGLPYTIHVVVNQRQGRDGETSDSVKGVRTFVTCGSQMKCTDSYPMGFPFDREIVETEFNVPNIRQADVVIYHKSMEESNKDI